MGDRKGDKTEPHCLQPLLVRDLDGSSIDWKLQSRIQIGEELLLLQSDGDVAQALNNYLRCREVWRTLNSEALNSGEQLKTYSLRHRYTKESHAANLPVVNITDGIGHSFEGYARSYGWVSRAAITAVVTGVINQAG